MLHRRQVVTPDNNLCYFPGIICI